MQARKSPFSRWPASARYAPAGAGQSRVLRRERGASLLEAIAYLGIAAIVVIGAVALLNGAFSSARSNEVSEQVNAIQTGVKKLYMGQGGYTGVTNAVLTSAKVFPSTMAGAASTDGTVTDAWNGAVTVATADAGSFTIEYDNVPQAVCVSAATSGGTWIAVSINGTSVSNLPVSPTDAQTDCNGGDANTIIWTSN